MIQPETRTDDRPDASTWLLVFGALFFLNIGVPALVGAAAALVGR